MDYKKKCYACAAIQGGLFGVRGLLHELAGINALVIAVLTMILLIINIKLLKGKSKIISIIIKEVIIIYLVVIATVAIGAVIFH